MKLNEQMVFQLQKFIVTLSKNICNHEKAAKLFYGHTYYVGCPTCGAVERDFDENTKIRAKTVECHY